MSEVLYYVILVIIIVDFLFEKLLDLLNDRRKSPVMPPEAAGIYDEERYATWLAYDKANGRLSMISSSINVLIILAVLMLGGFGWLDEQLRSFADQPVVLALLYFACLSVVSSFINLPFSIYATFVVEERFGFNRTTVKTFALDMLKSLGLSVLIGAPLGALIIWIYCALGDHFWWVAWIIISGFSLVMAMFAASWIMPIFNKFTPLEDGSLRAKIEAYCQQVGFQLSRLFVIDGSKRSAKSNAFFSGLGPKKTIALYDTLLNQLKENELVAVLAHEIGHYKKQHIAQSLVLSTLQTGLMLFILGTFLRMPAFSQALGATEASFHVGIIAFGIVFSPISTLIGLGMNALSRKNEFEADAFARSTHDGEALAGALRKLTAENLGNLSPHPAYVFVHYSHPPVLQRLERLIEKA